MYNRLILDISRLILGPSRLMSGSGSFQIRFCFQFELDLGFLLSLRRYYLIVKFVLDKNHPKYLYKLHGGGLLKVC